MSFEILEKELWPVADKVIQYLKNLNFRKIILESEYKEQYRFRPTILCEKRGNTAIVEVKRYPEIFSYFEDFIKECLVNRENVRIFIAFPHLVDNREISFSRTFLDKTKKYGIGVLIADDKETIVHKEAVQCNMLINANEFGLIYRSKREIIQILDKFNEGRFVDAIRDITELVEDFVGRLAIKASEKGQIVVTVTCIEKMSFEDRINLLSAPEWRGQRQKRYFDEVLKNDLKSHKGARILSHHPRNAKAEKRLERQLKERMYMGIRLANEVSKIKI